MLVGILLLFIRLSSSVITNFTDIEIGFIKSLLPLVLKPLMIYGFVCTIIGILMIIVYNIINKKIKAKKETKKVQEPKE